MPETPLDRRQLAIMFYVFLGIFSLVLIISILITTEIISIKSQGVKDNAMRLIYVSFSGAMLQLFYVAYSLHGKVEYEIHIAIIFPPGAGARVDLDPEKCHYGIYDRNNQTDGKLQLAVHRRGGSWECVVRLKDPEESVRLFLEDYSGAIWSTANIGMKLISADAIHKR
jgi:hypothetical protein